MRKTKLLNKCFNFHLLKFVRGCENETEKRKLKIKQIIYAIIL